MERWNGKERMRPSMSNGASKETAMEDVNICEYETGETSFRGSKDGAKEEGKVVPVGRSEPKESS